MAGVQYQVEDQPTLAYEWSVGGGEMTAAQGTSMMSIDWGTASDTAFVMLIHTNSFGCTADTLLPIRINVQLEPNMPSGDTLLCLNHIAGNEYTITPTAGSVYTWEAIGGAVTLGQGTPTAQIDWDGLGTHQVKVTEASTTPDAFCQGESQLLNVTIYEDTTSIQIAFVTLREDDEQISRLEWELNDLTRAIPPISIQRRQLGATAWETLADDLALTRTQYLDASGDFQSISYEYRVLVTNLCLEERNSDHDNTILLSGSTDPSIEGIILQWNAYLEWENGVARYEIWRKLDTELAHTYYDQVDGSTLTHDNLSGAEAFVHSYRIKAIGNAGEVSWANSIQLDFEHPLVFPNVFTPNGDGINETFQIPKIHLYPDNEITIYNRWGKQVHHQKAYQGLWDGGDLPSGVYYFIVQVGQEETSYKGVISIVR